MERKRVVQYFGVLVVLVAFLLVLNLGDVSLTGFAVFEDSGAGFDNGTYAGTEYNGSSVILAGGLQGNYTSQVFDAGDDSTWNNITLVRDIGEREDLFAVQGDGAVFTSNDSGANWQQTTSDYGRGGSTNYMFSDSSYLYIVFGGSAREVWRSQDGVTWSVVNDSFADSNLLVGDADSSNNLYVADTTGDVYQSTDSGATWTLKGDFNGGNTHNALGIAIDSSDNLFIVDASERVWMSSNSGGDWTEQNSSYGGSNADDLTVDGTDLYILNNRDVYRSTDSGATWTLVNDEFSTDQNGLRMHADSNYLYIIDPSGDVYRSDDSGASFSSVGDFNGGATNNVKGLTDFTLGNNLTYQFRNCSSVDCSDGSFVGPDGTGDTYFSNLISDIDLTGQYFQYKVYFDADASGLSPSLVSVSVDYGLNAVAPNVTISLPEQGKIYGNNESLPLNFSVSGDNLDSCWYTLDAGATNNTVASCENSTFSVGSSDSYTLVLYANESVSNLVGSDSVDFEVQIGAPDIEVISPSNNGYVNVTAVDFSFNATSDLGVDTCNLYGDFSGDYGLNQTNTSIVSGQLGHFYLNLTNSSYVWAVNCNNTQGVWGSTANMSFTVDLDSPEVSIFSPNGTYNTTDELPLNYSVNDTTSEVSECVYNITSTGGIKFEVIITDSDCDDNTVTVTTETSYDLILTAEDEAGNQGESTTSFNVNTGSSGGGSSGGGGGGGGGGGSGGGGFAGPSNLSISSLSQVSLKRGESQSLGFLVTNTGQRFLNDCKVKGFGDISSWISSDQIESLASGQSKNFVFDLNAPIDAESKEYTTSVGVGCGEATGATELVVIVVPSNFNFEILSVVRDGVVLSVSGIFTSFLDEEQEVGIEYILYNPQGIEVGTGEVFFSLGANAEEEFNFEVPLPKDAFGEFSLSLMAASGLETSSLDREVLLSESGITGFAISDSNLRSLSLFVIIVLVLGALAFAIRFVQKKHHKGKSNENHKKRFIKLKMRS